MAAVEGQASLRDEMSGHLGVLRLRTEVCPAQGSTRSETGCRCRHFCLRPPWSATTSKQSIRRVDGVETMLQLKLLKGTFLFFICCITTILLITTDIIFCIKTQNSQQKPMGSYQILGINNRLLYVTQIFQ